MTRLLPRADHQGAQALAYIQQRQKDEIERPEAIRRLVEVQPEQKMTADLWRWSPSRAAGRGFLKPRRHAYYWAAFLFPSDVPP
jgi:hypothetical protein